jgi:hypothetical protein
MMHIFTHYKLHRRTHFSIATTNYYLLYTPLYLALLQCFTVNTTSTVLSLGKVLIFHISKVINIRINNNYFFCTFYLWCIFLPIINYIEEHIFLSQLQTIIFSIHDIYDRGFSKPMSSHSVSTAYCAYSNVVIKYNSAKDNTKTGYLKTEQENIKISLMKHSLKKSQAIEAIVLITIK